MLEKSLGFFINIFDQRKTHSNCQ